VSPSNAQLKGQDLNNLRDYQVKGNVIYRQPLPFGNGWLFAGAELLASVTYTHEHGGFRDLAVDPSRLDGVDRLDARLGIDATHWSVMVNGTNVLDKQYDLFTANNGDQFRRNDPEYYWIELSWRMR
jgi:outer membrane receptor protein involved in Fe transport